MVAPSAAAGDAGTKSRPNLTLTRRLKAAPTKVWAAWTDPEKIARWFGPANIVPGSVRAEIDAKIGGRYRLRFASDTGEQHEVGGVYRELVTDKRLVFSWAWYSTPERESVVTVLLAPDGDGTLLTLHQEALFDEAVRDGHARGWSGALDRLESTIA
jgi:uncharacterized protein YndB with AHSA1/START domain